MLVHITTDKPVYKPNDVMFIELHLIDALTKKPVVSIYEQDLSLYTYLATFRVKFAFINFDSCLTTWEQRSTMMHQVSVRTEH